MNIDGMEREFVQWRQKTIKQWGNSLEDLRRMSFQGQDHFKDKVTSRLRSFQGQGRFKVKIISRSRSFQG